MTPLEELHTHLEAAWALALDVPQEETPEGLAYLTFKVGEYLGPEACFLIAAEHIGESGR